MIDTTCRYCVDQGKHCTPLTVTHTDGTARLVAMVHRRMVVVIEHYKDDPIEASWHDMMMAAALGTSPPGSLVVETKDLDDLQVWDK